MCSVTFWPQRSGYLLGMNRDELRSRVAALPPTRFGEADRWAVHPAEPSGGTWISLNDAGVGLALINWYAIGRRAPSPGVSRGEVIRRARWSRRPAEVTACLRELSLSRMNPFRLIGVFPGEERLCEWRWDVAEQSFHEHAWQPGQWLSSGFDEPGAQRVRSATFARWRELPDAGSLPWLRRLHASHEPERGAFSTCVHRVDAKTVSYAELEVTGERRRLAYGAESPCRLFAGAAAESAAPPRLVGRSCCSALISG